jgi:hypothetical protein
MVLSNALIYIPSCRVGRPSCSAHTVRFGSSRSLEPLAWSVMQARGNRTTREEARRIEAIVLAKPLDTLHTRKWREDPLGGRGVGSHGGDG